MGIPPDQVVALRDGMRTVTEAMREIRRVQDRAGDGGLAERLAPVWPTGS